MQTNTVEVTRLFAINGSFDIKLNINEDWVENPFPSLLFKAVQQALPGFSQPQDLVSSQDFISLCTQDATWLYKKESKLELRVAGQMLKNFEDLLMKKKDNTDFPPNLNGHVQISYASPETGKLRKLRLIKQVPAAIVGEIRMLYKQAEDAGRIADVKLEPRVRPAPPPAAAPELKPILKQRKLSEEELKEVNELVQTIAKCNARMSELLFTYDVPA